MFLVRLANGLQGITDQKNVKVGDFVTIEIARGNDPFMCDLESGKVENIIAVIS